MVARSTTTEHNYCNVMQDVILRVAKSEFSRTIHCVSLLRVRFHGAIAIATKYLAKHVTIPLTNLPCIFNYKIAIKLQAVANPFLCDVTIAITMASGKGYIDYLENPELQRHDPNRSVGKDLNSSLTLLRN